MKGGIKQWVRTSAIRKIFMLTVSFIAFELFTVEQNQISVKLLWQDFCRANHVDYLKVHLMLDENQGCVNCLRMYCSHGQFNATFNYNHPLYYTEVVRHF